MLKDPNYYQQLVNTTRDRRVPDMGCVPLPVMINADSGSVGYFAKGTDFMARDASVVGQRDAVTHRANMAGQQEEAAATVRYDQARLRAANLPNLRPVDDTWATATGVMGTENHFWFFALGFWLNFQSVSKNSNLCRETDS